jgi:hypothetical protein
MSNVKIRPCKACIKRWIQQIQHALIRELSADWAQGPLSRHFVLAWMRLSSMHPIAY